MKPKKVLFFDSWKGGLVHFSRLVKPLRAFGIEPLLVHLGSWGNESKWRLSEDIDGLNVRDIRYYSRSNLRLLLQQESPDLVLFLSCSTYAHRALNRYCRALKIPTVLLMHGLVSQGYDDSSDNYPMVKPNYRAHFGHVFSKAFKMFTLTFPTYMRSLFLTQGSLQEWSDFFVSAFRLLLNPNSISYKPADTKTNFCFVYTDADKPYLMNYCGFDPKQMVVVGNPDLTRFGLTEETVTRVLHRRSTDHEKVMYIDTAFWNMGFFFKDVNEYVSHLSWTQRQLQKQGKTLLFKPHPVWHTKGFDLTCLHKFGIECVSENDFLTALEACCAAIVEPSSLALVPALLGLPLLLTHYGKLSLIQWGTFFTSYPRAIMLGDVEHMTSLLAQEQSHVDRARVLSWIKENIGPLPAEEMPSRVSGLLKQYMDAKRECYV